MNRLLQWVRRHHLGVLTVLSILLAGVLAPHYLSIGRGACAQPSNSDFLKFYVSAQREDQGLSMYWLMPPRDRMGDPCNRDTPPSQVQLPSAPSHLYIGSALACLAPNLNPPVFLALIVPLSHLTYATAYWAWSAAELVGMVLCVWCWSGIFGLPWTHRMVWTLVGSSAMLAYYPGVANFWLGQVGWLIALPLSRSWLSMRQGREWHSGLWLGLAIALKPIWALLAMFLLPMKAWRALAGAMLASLTMTSLGVLLFGWQAQLDYVHVAGHVTWTGQNWNASWLGLFDRHYMSLGDASWPRTRNLSHALAGLFGLLTCLVTARLIAKWGRDPGTCADSLFSLGVPATLLACPLGWLYYFPILAIGWLSAWQRGITAPKRRPLLLGTVLAVIMLEIPLPLKPSPTALHPSTWLSFDTWYFCALLVDLMVLAASFRGTDALRNGVDGLHQR